jgi:hypothetical protein
MIRVAASLTGLTVVLGLVLYLTLNDGDSSTSPDTSPTPFVAASPTATPKPIVDASTMPTATPIPDSLLELLEGTGVEPMTQGAPIGFPNDVAFLIATGCWFCEGWPTGISRVSKGADGDVITEVLFSPDLMNLPQRLVSWNGETQEMPAHVMTLDASDDGSFIAVAVCTVGFCGALGESGPDGETTIFTSRDGGITWAETSPLAGVHHVVGLSGGDVVIAGPAPLSVEEPPAPYYYLSTGIEITPPEVADVPERWPISTPDGDLLWSNGHGTLVTSSGEHFFSHWSYSDLISVSDGVWGISWNWPNYHFLTYVDRDGNFIRSFDSRQSVRYGPAAGGYHYGNADIDPDLLNADSTGAGMVYLPVRIDFERGTYHPILDPFIGDGAGTGRNHVVAVQTGPFARIDGTGSCLNLRTSPGIDATKVDCLADGVLLRHATVVVTNQDVEWLQVTAPDGTEGWAATEFLEW